MKRILACILAVCLPVFALADPVVLEAPLTGTVVWPEDADQDSAVYIYQYSFPKVAGDSAAAEGINTFFADYLEDVIAFTVPVNGESIDNTDELSTTDISAQVTCNTDNAFSVFVRSRSHMDGYDYETYSGYVFARSGPKEGLVIALPHLLGILGDSETDTWLQDRQTAKADKCVRDLIWAEIEENPQGRVYLPDISYELFQDMFYPEEDFYLDETGNPVVVVQPGILTPEEDGVLLFPISLDLILDEI